MLLSVLASINLSTNVIKLAHARLDALGVRDGAHGGLVGSHDGKDLSKDLYREHKDRKEYKDRKEHKDRQAVRPQRPPWHNLRLAPNRLWLAAMVVFIIANLANFASFAFAAQSLLAALGSIQFVSNVVFARLVNKERITRQTVIGTLVIVGGCIVLVMFGSHDSPAYTVDDLLDLYGNPGYIVYLCVGATVAVTSYAAFWWIKQKRGQRNLALYVLFSALVGTQSVLYGKSLSLLFRAALDGTNVAAHWYSWICLVAFLAAAVYWVRRFNKVRYGFPRRCRCCCRCCWNGHDSGVSPLYVWLSKLVGSPPPPPLPSRPLKKDETAPHAPLQQNKNRGFSFLR